IQDLQQTSFVAKSFLRGNLLILGGCAGSAFYNVYCKGLMRKFGEMEILICSYITASLSSLVILRWQDPHCLESLRRMDGLAWIVLGLNSLLVYGISMLMFFYVLRFIPVTVASA